MKNITLAAISFGIFIAQITAALTHDDITRLMDEKPVQGYDIDPSEHGLPPSSSGFIILNYDDALVEGIWEILENPEQQRNWKQAYRTLRRIAAADSKSINYNKLIGQIKKVEESKSIDDGTKIDLLMLGYPAVARHRSNRAFDFLKVRTDFEFWEKKEISRTVYNSHGAGSEGILQTAQSMAINAMSEHQTEEAYELLQSLFADERYTSMPHLNIVLSGALEYGGWQASASRLKNIQTEYVKRLELRNESAPIQVGDGPGVKITPVRGQAESTEEGTVTEKPVEAVTVEPSQEPTEQSSQWWLWLIGAVVVIGGLGLILRRKS